MLRFSRVRSVSWGLQNVAYVSLYFSDTHKEISPSTVQWRGRAMDINSSCSEFPASLLGVRQSSMDFLFKKCFLRDYPLFHIFLLITVPPADKHTSPPSSQAGPWPSFFHLTNLPSNPFIPVAVMDRPPSPES